MALRMITAGESHGPGLTCILEGLPAGLTLDRDALNRDLARRQLGHGRGGRMKIERDQVEVTGGVRHGRTLGGPIALQVVNRDYANWEERMNPWPVEARVARGAPAAPGPRRSRRHPEVRAQRCARHPRARERARDRGPGRRRRGRQGVPAGARRGGVLARDPDHRRQRAPRRDDLRPADFDAVDESPVRCLDPEATRGDGRRDRPAAQGERVARRGVRGARVRARPGLGSHVSWEERLDGRLGQAILSIQAIKARRDRRRV